MNKYCSPSKLGVILGVSHFKTLQEQFDEDMGIAVPDYTHLEQMRMLAGHIFEDSILDLYQAWTKNAVDIRQKFFRIEELNFEGTVDGIDIANLMVVDAKNTDKENLEIMDYWLQMQGYMFLTSYKHSKLICPDGHYKVHEKYIERDDDFITTILPDVILWYNGCIDSGELTDMPTNAQLFVDIFNIPKAADLELDETSGGIIKDYVDEYAAINRDIKILETRQDEIRDNLKSMLGDKRGKLNYGGGRSLSYVDTSRKGKLNEQSLLAENPQLDLNKYREENSNSTTLTIRAGKGN